MTIQSINVDAFGYRTQDAISKILEINFKRKSDIYNINSCAFIHSIIIIIATTSDLDLDE